MTEWDIIRNVLFLIGGGLVGFGGGRAWRALKRRIGTRRPDRQESGSDRLLWLPTPTPTTRFARVEVQRVMLLGTLRSSGRAHRAVCWHHGTDESGIIPRWMGETHLVADGKASWFAAEADARAHDRAEHRA